jgi:hypothetical protein
MGDPLALASFHWSRTALWLLSDWCRLLGIPGKPEGVTLLDVPAGLVPWALVAVTLKV